MADDKYDFSEMFDKSGGKPIQFKGKTLVAWDPFPLHGNEVRLKIRFVSTNSEWRQGIGLDVDGEFDFFRARLFPKGVVLWEDTAPTELEFICRSSSGVLDVKNVWDTGDGCVESWYYGAAMWVEEIPGGRRYHCNDGHPDDNFDDIIFELTRVD